MYQSQFDKINLCCYISYNNKISDNDNRLIDKSSEMNYD